LVSKGRVIWLCLFILADILYLNLHGKIVPSGHETTVFFRLIETTRTLKNNKPFFFINLLCRISQTIQTSPGKKCPDKTYGFGTVAEDK
jgi:hypothetical protein